MSKGNPFLAVRVTPDTLDAFRRAAAAKGQDLSGLVREILSMALLAESPACAIVHLGESDAARPATRRTKPRRTTRIARLRRIEAELDDLLSEYTDWQSNLPEFAQ